MRKTDKTLSYSTIVYGLCYELCLWIASWNPAVSLKPWFKALKAHCFSYWVDYKTFLTMEALEGQEEGIQRQWEEEDKRVYVDPVYSETGSGFFDEMRLSAPWSISVEKSEEST